MPAHHIIANAVAGLRVSGRALAAPQRANARRTELTSPRASFVNFLQNHDQIGNRPKGERLSVLASPTALKPRWPFFCCSPPRPCCLWARNGGATEPFPFFCDLSGERAEAVRKGRKAEFADAYAKHGSDIPVRLRPRPAPPPCSIGRRVASLRMPRASRSRARSWPREGDGSCLCCRR